MATNIFNLNKDKEQPTQGISGSVFTVDRLDLLTKDVADELNTYRTWDDVSIPVEGVLEDFEVSGTGKDQKVKEKYVHGGASGWGKKSLFNNTTAVMGNSNIQIAANAPLLDGPETRERIHKMGICTVGELCRASKAGEMGREIYNYADFMYCKHLGKVSNNYLITLRRFPYPCGDFIGQYLGEGGDFRELDSGRNTPLQSHLPDIGRMITWMGVSDNTMDKILKFSVNMPYKELKAEMQTVDEGGENGGLLGTLLNMGNPRYLRQVRQGRAGTAAFGMINNAMSTNPIFAAAQGIKKGNLVGFDGQLGMSSQEQGIRASYEHMDRNKVYGPVDSVTKTSIREDPAQGGEGLKFEQSITLTFEYELRSYDGINSRAAMLDLLANILAVTYTTGGFWGGGFRSTGSAQSSVFANLPIYRYADTADPLTYRGIQDSAIKSVQQVGKAMGFEGKNFLEKLRNGIKSLGSGMMSMLFGAGLNALGRPTKQALNSLISPAPVGLWHLTIGNPKHPIMSMGNMILDNTEISFNGPLGLDDFPTQMKVTITLKHAKPRDAGDIEKMFMFGDWRIYTPMDKNYELLYNSSSDVKNHKNNNRRSTKDGAAAPAASPHTEKTDGQDISQQFEKWEQGALKKIYMKYFGTADKKNISWSMTEAFKGSDFPTNNKDTNSNSTQNSSSSTKTT